MGKYTVELEVAGPFAIWTRPDVAYPTSYAVPTYTAAKGLFEAIWYNPCVEVIPIECRVCFPLAYDTLMVNYRGPLRKEGTDNFQVYHQILVDVCYQLIAELENINPLLMTDNMRLGLSRTTNPSHYYKDRFERMIKKGQAYRSPFLGMKQFACTYFGPFRPETEVNTTLCQVIGSMPRNFHKGESKIRNVPILDGVLRYA